MLEYKVQFVVSLIEDDDQLEALCAIVDLLDEGDVGDLLDPDRMIDAGIHEENFDFFNKIMSEDGGPGVETAFASLNEEDLLPGETMQDHGLSKLYLVSRGGGNVESLVPVLQWWLEKNNSDKAIQFDYAFTSSPASSDGFGGGAVHITKDETVWLDTKGWMSQQLARTHPVIEKDESPTP